MADSLTLNSGCGGANLAVDSICEACTVRVYQYVKHAFGPDNTATLVTACAGLPVDVKNATLAVTDNCGALTIDNTNLCNLHSADFDTGAGTDTTPAIGIALPGCGGAVVGGTSTNPIRTDPTGTTTQPVSDACGSLTVDNAGLTALCGAISGTEVQVDIVAALPAGTNAIGKLAANSGVDIGDVDILSVVPGTGATNLGKAEDAVHATGDVGIMALGVRTDTPASLAGTDGDYAPFQLGSNGALLSHDIVLDDVIGTVGSAAPCCVVVIGANDACGNVRQPLLLNTANDGQANTQIALLTTTRLFGYNGTTWDRVRVDGCDNLQVNINAALPAGTNAIGKLAANSGVDIGDVDILSIAAGSNCIGTVGVNPQASGGWCVFRSIDLDESEEQVKASAGQMGIIMAFNASCALRYLKVYNAPSACVTVGGACATTPTMTIPVPAHACSKGAGLIFSCPAGFCLGGTGITVAATTGVADCDTGAPGANEVIVNIGYA